jgi:hypothetical protein
MWMQSLLLLVLLLFMGVRMPLLLLVYAGVSALLL